MTGTSWKRKVTTAIVAAAMAASMLPMSAFADTATAMTLDNAITVGGLEDGDKASFYRIIEQDLTTWAASDTEHTGTPTHVGTQGWKLTSLVDKPDANGVQDGIVDGTEDMEFGRTDDQGHKIKGLRIEDLVITKNPDDAANPLTPDDKKVITAQMANAIASALSTNNAAATYADVEADGGIAQVSGTDKPLSGLYMVVAEPGTTNINTVYKPIFVSADYHATDGTNRIDLVADPATAPAEATDYLVGTAGVFKRSDLDVDKRSGVYNQNDECTDTQHDVQVGDKVVFTITTTIPTYSSNYTSPVYKLTDQLTKGLELTDDEITVTVEGYTAETCKKGTDYKVTKNAANDGFTVEFLNDKDNNPTTKDGFLYTVLGSPKVTITYKALVKEDAVEVNQMDNTVKLNFSNKLDDTSGKGELQDKTRHYTFNIDANVFGRDKIPGEGQTPGSDQEKTSEVRKVAINADGTITETIVTNTIPGEPTDYSWLQGAKFELQQTHEYKTTDPENQQAADNFVALASPEVVKFNDNQVVDANGKAYVTSDAKGYIAMKGLDAGVYVLHETDAPLGYSFDNTISYKITITPEYDKEGDSSTDPNDENEILSGYTVEVEKLKNNASLSPAQKTTSHYTVATEGQGADATPISFLNQTFTDADGDGVTEGVDGSIKTSSLDLISLDTTSQTTYIVNKKLGILPATGGSGIIFYLVVGGAIAGTAALLIEKDRKKRSMA